MKKLLLFCFLAFMKLLAQAEVPNVKNAILFRAITKNASYSAINALPSIAVTPISENALSTTYGTPSTSANSYNVAGNDLSDNILVTSPTGFEVSSNNSIYAATATLPQTGGTLYLRLNKNSNVGTYSGNLIFESGDVVIKRNLPASNINTTPLTVTATFFFKRYGVALVAGPSNANFSVSGALASGETITGVTLTPDAGGLSATTPAGSPFSLTPSAATGAGGFLASNYNINYVTYNGTVSKITVLISAANVTKTFGSTLTSGTGFTSFISAGLAANETIGSVTVTYGTGAAASDAVGTYTGQIIISAATGGTFNPSNYNFSYGYGNIVVTSTPTPAISVRGNLSSISSTFGSASISGSFTVSGTNMTAGITVTPPSGFEVSSNNTTFFPSVVIGSAGTIVSTPVYVRLAKANNAGSYNGSIVASSSGASNVSAIIPTSVVNKYNLTITANNINKAYGNTLSDLTGSTAYLITSGSLQNGNTISSVTITYKIGALAAAPVTTNTGTVIPSLAVGSSGFSTDNYQIIYTNGNIVVDKIPLTIRANNVTKTYDGLTYTEGHSLSYVGFISGDNAANSVTGTVNFGGSWQGAIAANSYTIVPSGLAANNYDISHLGGTLTINKATASIALSNLNHVYDGSSKAATVTTTPTGLNDITITYNGSTIAPTAANSYSVIASLNNANYTASDATGTLTISSVLPVSFGSFIAAKQGNKAKLIWNTLSEQNSKSFTVYRSNDGVKYNEIARLPAKGNSSTINEYVVLDGSPLNGINYYQLKQTDINGKTFDLDQKILNFSLDAAIVQAWPNPVDRLLKINFTAGLYQQLKLSNMSGQVLESRVLGKTTTNASVSMETYPKGFYLLTLVGEEGNYTARIIK